MLLVYIFSDVLHYPLEKSHFNVLIKWTFQKPFVQPLHVQLSPTSILILSGGWGEVLCASSAVSVCAIVKLAELT